MRATQNEMRTRTLLNSHYKFIIKRNTSIKCCHLSLGLPLHHAGACLMLSVRRTIQRGTKHARRIRRNSELSKCFLPNNDDVSSRPSCERRESACSCEGFCPKPEFSGERPGCPLALSKGFPAFLAADPLLVIRLPWIDVVTIGPWIQSFPLLANSLDHREQPLSFILTAAILSTIMTLSRGTLT